MFRQALGAILLAAVAIVGVTPGRGEAAVILITPTDDDRGIDAFLDGNFICCQLDSGQGTVTLSLFFEERFGLEFALGGLPADAAITSATLTLHVAADPPVVNSADVHGYAGDGTIAAADLTVSNLLTGFQVSAMGPVDIAIDPAFIQDLLTTNEDFAGFMLRNVTNPTGVFTIWTSDSGFDQFNPTLAIEYEVVPEPSSLVLLGTALAVLGRRATRRARR